MHLVKLYFFFFFLNSFEEFRQKIWREYFAINVLRLVICKMLFLKKERKKNSFVSSLFSLKWYISVKQQECFGNNFCTYKFTSLKEGFFFFFDWTWKSILSWCWKKKKLDYFDQFSINLSWIVYLTINKNNLFIRNIARFLKLYIQL